MGSKSAEKQAKSAAQAAEREAAALRIETEKQRAKAERERNKANTILARGLRAKGGGSYESNPQNTKLG